MPGIGILDNFGNFEERKAELIKILEIYEVTGRFSSEAIESRYYESGNIGNTLKKAEEEGLTFGSKNIGPVFEIKTVSPLN